jgi:glycogen synthase
VPAVARRPQRPLRIGLVCAGFGTPEGGGIATYTQHLAESLSDRGHSVVVIRAGGPQCVVKPRGYQVAEVQRFRTASACHHLGLYQTLLALGTAAPFDIVEAPLWAGEACAVGLAGKFPLVVRLETPSEVVRQVSGLPQTTDSAVLVAAERLELSYAAGAIAISQAIRKTVEDAYDVRLEIPSRKAAVIPLGLPPSGTLLIEPVNLGAAPRPRFLFVGRLEARKGIEELGEAFATVAQRLPNATLWVAGADNSHHDGFKSRTGVTYVDWLRRRWGSDVASRVRFLGSVSEGVKNYLFSQCDIFVAPSRYESFGLVFLEAMRFGKPVLSTTAGGIPEVVLDGQTGLLVPPASVDRLAAALLRLGEDAELRQRLGASGLARFHEVFSLNSCALRTEQFYYEVIKAWDGAARCSAADWETARSLLAASNEPTQAGRLHRAA